jgi:hypothetical protein
MCSFNNYALLVCVFLIVAAILILYRAVRIFRDGEKIRSMMGCVLQQGKRKSHSTNMDT